MKVLIADDNGLIRVGLRVTLELMNDVEAVYEADNGARAIEVATEQAVDIALLDVNMPTLDGIAALPRLLEHTRVIMLTNTDDLAVVRQAMDLGASGYIIHGSLDPAGIATAVRACLAGGIFTAGIGAGSHTFGSPPEPAAAGVRHLLSEREAEIMDIIATGRTNSQIARSLFLSEKTVKNHVNRIFSKLSVTSRAEAVAVWLDHSDQHG